MSDSIPSTTVVPAAPAVDARPDVSPFLTILRDIARGGIAGILVGIFVAGIGGRIVMRLATILHEERVGMLTENGEVIGRISLGGTMALITFGGLGMGLLAGVIWVIVGPWIPGRGLGRAAITAALAVAIGSPALIQGGNVDFFILDHDPLVVAMLVALVAAVGFSMALVDGALDRRLPPAVPKAGVATLAYGIVTPARPRPDPATGDRHPVRSVRVRGADPGRLGACWPWALCTLAWWVLRDPRSHGPTPRPAPHRSGSHARHGRPRGGHRSPAHPGGRGRDRLTDLTTYPAVTTRASAARRCA